MKLAQPRSLLPALGALVTAASCSAQGWPHWQLDGFASLAAGFTLNEGSSSVSEDVVSREKATFDTNTGVYDDGFSFRPETLLGLQTIATLEDQLGFTLQVTAEADDDFEPKVRWAFFSYDIADRWKILAGRQRLPLFLYSDSRQVGYSYHWVRPPTEVNSPAEILDGVLLQRNFQAQRWDSSLQLYYGDGSGDAEEIGNFRLENDLGVVITIGNHWIQYRATLSLAELSADQLHDPERSSADPVDTFYSGFAVRANWRQWFLVSEVSRNRFEDPLANSFRSASGAYLSLGYEVGNFTPHITWGVYELRVQETDLVRGGDNRDQSITLGVRWDLHPGAALKLEYLTRSDESDRQVKSTMGDIRATDLLSMRLDLVF